MGSPASLQPSPTLTLPQGRPSSPCFLTPTCLPCIWAFPAASSWLAPPPFCPGCSVRVWGSRASPFVQYQYVGLLSSRQGGSGVNTAALFRQLPPMWNGVARARPQVVKDLPLSECHADSTACLLGTRPPKTSIPPAGRLLSAGWRPEAPGSAAGSASDPLPGARDLVSTAKGQAVLCGHASELGCSQGSNTFYYTWPGRGPRGTPLSRE